MMIDFLGIDTINAYIQELGCKETVLHNPIDFVISKSICPLH